MKKSILTASLVMSLGAIGLANAETTTGDLHFKFSGEVPEMSTMDPLANGWKFSTLYGETYTPPAEIVMHASDGTNKGDVLLTSVAETFYMVGVGEADEGDLKDFAPTSIEVEVTEKPSVFGSAIKAEATGIVTTVYINGEEVPHGKSIPLKEIDTTVKEFDAKEVGLTVQTTVPEAARTTEGGQVSVSTSLLFTVNLGA